MKKFYDLYCLFYRYQLIGLHLNIDFKVFYKESLMIRYAINLSILLLLYSPLNKAEIVIPNQAQFCISCHGQGGYSQQPQIPRLAGLSARVLERALSDFGQNKRPDPIAHQQKYTEVEHKAIIEYFSQQDFRPVQQKVDAERAKQGAIYHTIYCEKCHVKQGSINKLGSSILAGQWMPYLQKNLIAYQQGKRDMPRKMARRMDALVSAEDPSSLEDLLHFYAQIGNQNIVKK
jgi:sulfide dehydrogenase cytochrome subunit